jgi:hypothetical protein
MWRATLVATMLAAALPAGGPAGAWLLYPDRDDPSRWIVEIEQPYGDVVALGSLPKPFSTIVQPDGEAEPLLYRWRYGRQAVGSAVLTVNREGRGTIEFAFFARDLIDGQRLGAAAVLVAEDGTPLHTFYARADSSEGRFADGTAYHRVHLTLDRARHWWQAVDAIAFFNMTYHPLQKLDDEQVWAAMRHAVRRFTKGQGTEQRSSQGEG